MPAYKDKKRGTWYASFHYVDWMGKNRRKVKRGFKTKKEAQLYEESFKLKEAANLDMTFGEFVTLYEADVRPKLKENTWESKWFVIEKKILPYFQFKQINRIEPKDIIKWQNMMRGMVDSDGKGYSPNYLKTCQSQLSAIFNHAVRYYNLRRNPVSAAGPMGGIKKKEMLFWTKEEYLKFIEAIADKSVSYYAFEMLYWAGIRMGELLALTKSDFDFNSNTLSINKSYQRIKGKDVVTSPKTEMSNRTIVMPEFLANEMRDYIDSLYKPDDNDRLFCITKSYLHHEMDRGVKDSGVKRIRIHDLRHSHISLLCRLGFNAVEIGKRVGHESIRITYQYAHMFPTVQTEMASRLSDERREGLEYVGEEHGSEKQMEE